MINKDKKYVLIYVSISFRNNLSFLKRLKKDYGFEVPYLDITLSDELKSVLDSYLYMEVGLHNKNIFSILYSKYKHITFVDLGIIEGEKVCSLINNCMSKAFNSLKIGEYYKLIKHPFENLIVKVVDISEDHISCDYDLMGEKREIKVHISQIGVSENKNLMDIEAQTIDYIGRYKEMGESKAIIIDGHNVLFRSMFGYGNYYTAKDHKFVGGAYGTYITLLKLKEMFPEYEIHFVFDSKDKIKFESNPEYKKNRMKLTESFRQAFQENLNWVKRFVLSLGFNYYRIEGCEGDDVVGSVAWFLENWLDYKHILVYSNDKDFYSIVTDRVELYVPKVEFRGVSVRITKQDAINKFSVKEVRKINWVRAIEGDSSDSICAINKFNKENGLKCSKVKKQHFLEIINNFNSIEEMKNELLKNKKFKLFVESGKFDSNLKLLTIRTDIFNSYRELSSFTGICNYDRASELMEEFCFFKELEMFSRSFKVLRGVW